MGPFSLSERRFWAFLIMFSAVAFLFMYHYAGAFSFWGDELYTVSSIRNGLSFVDTVKIYATYDKQSPLYPFIAYFWYRLVPHTEQALRALSIIFTVFGCVMAGILGRKLYGVRFGIFSFLLTFGSYNVLSNAAHEFRPYSLVLFVSLLNCYLYLRRLENESWLNIILYGFAMSLMPYTHYVSVFLCFGLFIADCILIIRKRARFRVIASYVLGAAIFLPWAYVLVINMGSKFLSFWPQIPSLVMVLRLSKWLTGAECVQAVTFMAAVFGFFCILRNVYALASVHEKFPAEIIFLLSGIFASVFMILSVYIYSRYINPQGSFFVERYFFPVVPFAVMAEAYGMNFMYEKMKAVFHDKTKLFFAVMLIMILAANFGRAARHKFIEQPYREAAEFIRKHEAEYSGGKSAILSTGIRYLHYGWEEMYLSLSPYTELLPSHCMAPRYEDHDTNILESLKARHYDRIYFCFIFAMVEDKSAHEIISWLRENYDFEEVNEDCNVQIWEARR